MEHRLTPLNPGFLLWPMALGFLAVLFRLIQLQAFPETVRVHAVQRRAEVVQLLTPPRGRILDRHGRLLAADLPAYSLVLDLPPEERRYTRPTRALLGEAARLELQPVAELAGVQLGDLMRKLQDPGRTYSMIAGGLSRGTASRLLAHLKSMPASGLQLRETALRSYPQGKTLAHVVGFLRENEDGQRVGGLGLEAACQAQLSGGVQGHRVAKPVARSFGADPLLDVRDARPPADIRTTLDAHMGNLLREELLELALEHRPDWVSGVILDVKTSDILAAGAWPDFDPGHLDQGARDALGNLIGLSFPGQWPFEPGSTLKPFVVSTALAEGAISPGERFSQEGGKWRIRGPRSPPIHNALGVPDEPLDWHGVLLHSSNIGAGKIGLRLGAAGLQRAFSNFGLFGPSGLPGRDPHILRPSESQWAKTRWTVTAVSMGHQVQTTLVRLAAAYGAMAGDGILREPGLFLDRPRPQGRRAVPPEVAALIRGALVDVVEHPRRRWLHQEKFRWGGKSGTVQKTHGNEAGQYASLFVGFAPLVDPQWIVAVLAENPHGKEHYGSKVAGPAVRDILARCSLEWEGSGGKLSGS